jgi:hypothetical protein
MTNAELIATIRNKVEGQFSVFLNLLNASQEYGYHKALEFVLSVLSDIEKSEKPVSNDLEEAADNHIRRVIDAAGHPGWNWTTQDIREAFIAGYNLCKEQMMKEAVEGEVVKDISNKLAVTAKINLDGFKFGDKVRIIIVKED